MLNSDQTKAVAQMREFLAAPGKPFFLLSGAAGTGKTFCIRALAESSKERFVFTAPTNKATKVLREAVTSEDFKPLCRTIYSLLGLQLLPNGAVKELVEPDDPVDLSRFGVVVVDEASMISSVLWKFIETAAATGKLKFILMGDKAQLPPVGEKESPVWGMGADATLEEQMRSTSKLIGLANDIRKAQSAFLPTVTFLSQHDETGGVVFLSSGKFRDRLMMIAESGQLSDGRAKAIAWRNTTVDTLNAQIRTRLFDNSQTHFWLVGDRVILTEPAKNLSFGEGQPTLLASTDDEGLITAVRRAFHPEYPEIHCFNIDVTLDDNRLITLWVPVNPSEVKAQASVLAERAKISRHLWTRFWEFKEAFHSLRHAYAITAHRAQGSSYETALVDTRDILLNRNRLEAFQCLYVAVTRPKTWLYLS